MARYIVTSRAEADINEIIAYIAVDNFDAAMVWYDRMLELLRMISENPNAGRLRLEMQDEVRCFPARDYLIFYRKWAEEIAITRILHSARDLDTLFR